MGAGAGAAAGGGAAGGGGTCAVVLGELFGGFWELVSFAGFLLHAASKQITKASARNDVLGFIGAPTYGEKRSDPALICLLSSVTVTWAGFRSDR